MAPGSAGDRAIEAQVADHVVLLRRAAAGALWIAAMTDWTPRELTIPLSFLGSGRWTAEVWEDGLEAAREATDARRVERVVRRAEALPIRMAPGRGFVARIARAR
jgi:alpha-glucosidase